MGPTVGALRLGLARRPTWDANSSELGPSRRGTGSAWLVGGTCRVVRVASTAGAER